MDKIITCPQCQGNKTMPILDSKKFDTTGIVEWLDKPCSMCNGEGLVKVDADKLNKIVLDK